MTGCGHEAHTWIWGKRQGAYKNPAGDWRYQECPGSEDAPAPPPSVVPGRAEAQGGSERQQEFIGPAHPNYQGPKAVHTAYDYAVVEILRVVDGDTVDARVETDWEDKGFHVEVKTRTAHRFRLIGVDTPERGQPGWAEATEFTRTWLVGPLRVRTHKSDSFGRWMGEFYDPVSGRSLGAALLEAGHARVWPA